MNYWLDLFTGTTWDEFRSSGATVSGFRKTQRQSAKRVKPGDVLICYLTGVSRWVGALEVVGESKDTRRIWKADQFPVRFDVKPLVMLNAEHGVPMDQLKGKVAFFASASDKGGFKGFLRRSPNLFQRPEDGAFILEALREAERNPIARPVDAKKLARSPLYRADERKGKSRVATLVSIPGAEEAETPIEPEVLTTEAEERSHTEIQHALLSLGAGMGLDVWVARNDRGRTWRGERLGDMPRMVGELPTQFNEATNKTIELIDVLWLRGNSIESAFEVECTTAIYSGLLRMSDLLALQPNLDIKLYIVAPDHRLDKIEAEILRPTFKLREKPLYQVCGFLAFSKLMEKIDGIRQLGLVGSLRPDFLLQTARFFGADSEQD